MASVVDAVVAALLSAMQSDRDGGGGDRRPIPAHHPDPKGGNRNDGPIPTVGANAANEVRLTPELRSLLRRRVTRQNRREFNPAIQALRSQKQAINRGLQKDLAGINEFTEAASNAIASQDLKGLQGRYKSQVAEELAQRSADVAQSGPILASEARAGAQEERADLRQQILDARITKKQAIEKELSSAVSAARTDAQATIGAREDAHDAAVADRQDATADNRAGLRDALRRAESLLITGPGGDKPWKLPETEAEWRRFELAVENGEGIQSPQAQKAVEAARRHVLALQELGLTRQDLHERVEAQGIFPFG